MTILQYVEINSNLVYIDTRIYCRDVINVDHGNWLSDILEEYRYLVEARFGAIRFETDVLKHEKYKGSTRQKYALLTEPQCNAYLVFSRNTGNVAQKKLDLIEDFEKAKQLLKEQLERSLNATINEINPMIDASRFDFTFDAALQVTGHQNRRDTLERLLGYLEIDTDYRWDGAKLYLSNPIYYSFIAASRTTKGIDTSQIGETVVLDWNYYCRVNKALKTPRNNLFANKRAEEKQINKPEQQTLF